MGQYLDTFEQAGGVQRAGEELLPAGAYCGQARWRVGIAVAEEQQRNLLLQTLLHRVGKFQAGAGEIDVHDDGSRVALADGGAEGELITQGLRCQAEEIQLLGQTLGALGILQGQVHRFAQWWQEGLFEGIAMTQTGSRQALHGLIEAGDQGTVETPTVFHDVVEAGTDVLRQLRMFDLLETLGVTQQAQVGLGQLSHAGIVPFAALQALPDFQHLACLVNHALGEMMLEAIATGIQVLGHGPTSIGG